MKVYKFRSTTAMHIRSLRKNELYASTYKNLNDPFEATFTKNSLDKWTNGGVLRCIKDYYIYGHNREKLPLAMRKQLDEIINSLPAHEKRRRKKHPERFARDNLQTDINKLLVPIYLIKATTESMLMENDSKGIYSLSKTILNELMWAHYVLLNI